jgi:hypothetical protein
LPFTFTRASTATRVNESGLIESVASGVPRIDFLDNADGHLLLEPSRTNLLNYSEEPDNAYWTKSRVTISANTSGTTDPSGNNNADLVTQDAADTNGGVVLRSLTFTAASHTFSVFAKMNEVRYINLAENVSSGSTRRTWFDLQSGAVGTTNGGHTAKIENYGNGWYRCSITFTALAIANSVFVYLCDADSSTTAVVSKGSYLYGIQLEAGSYATSYIPTSGAAVTRAADASSQTPPSGIIGQTEGAFILDVNLDKRISFTYFALAPSLGSTTNYLGISFNANSIVFETVASNVLQAAITFNNSSTGRFKIAVAYKANDFVMYVNGTQVGTDTSGSIPACSQVGLYNYSQTPSVKYNQVRLYNTRLSNSELAALTSL